MGDVSGGDSLAGMNGGEIVVVVRRRRRQTSHPSHRVITVSRTTMAPIISLRAFIPLLVLYINTLGCITTTITAKKMTTTHAPSPAPYVVLNRTSVSGECTNMMSSPDIDYLSHCCTKAFRGNESILEPIGCPPHANVTCYHIMFWPSQWFFQFTDSTNEMLSPDCIKDIRPPHVFAYTVEASGRACTLVYEVVEGSIYGLTPNGTTLSPSLAPTKKINKSRNNHTKKKRNKKFGRV